MKKIVVICSIIMLLCGFALGAVSHKSPSNISTSAYQPNAKGAPIQTTVLSQKTAYKLAGQIPENEIDYDNSGTIEQPSNSVSPHQPPMILADVSESEPNDTPATADTILCGDRVFCGSLDNSLDPTDYFFFTLDNTYPLWRVIIETTPTDALECTPTIAGTSVALYNSATPTNRNLIGYDTYSGANGTHGLLMVEELPPGDYWIRIRRDTGLSGFYHATLECVPDECDLVCPPGATPEGEVIPDTNYVDTYNMGCSATPNVFTPIAIDETICGNSGTWAKGTGVSRDLDWYSFTLADARDIAITVNSEFFSMIYLFEGPCPGTFIDGYFVLPCEEWTFTASLDAGTYYIQFLPANFRFGPEVPQVLEYQITLTAPVIGDDCALPISIPSLPFVDTRDACAFSDDFQPLPSLTGPDMIYQFVLAEETTVDISLCNTNPNTFDTWLGVWGDGDCGTTNFLAYDDDACTSPEFGTSEISNLTLLAGTYYIIVDGYGDCQEYELDVTPVAPCAVVCPPGSIPEGEIDCFDGYYDNYNPGCNEEGQLFTAITLGDTICGTGGYYARNDSTLRDTDWYTITTTQNGMFTYTGLAEHPLQLLIVRPGPPGDECTDGSYSIIGSVQVAACDTAVIEMPLVAGTYYLWAGPYINPTACGSTYWISASWEFMPDFPLVGLAQTGNVPNVGVSNFAALGENTMQGNTFNWSTNGSKDYAGTFIFGNSPSYLFWKYGGNDEEVQPGTGNLNMTDPFHPVGDFNDNGTQGLDVKYCGQGYTEPVGADDIFLHTYRLINHGATAISDLYGAIYMDWDVGASDTVHFDRANSVIYQQAVGVEQYYCWALVNTGDVPLRNLTSISQEAYSYPNSGWLASELWGRISHDGDGIPYDTADCGSMISTGPYTIAPGDTATIVFAQFAAPTVPEVVAHAALARTLDNPCLLSGPTGCDYIPGDINGNGATNGIDVTYGVNYFKGGALPPDTCTMCPQAQPFYAAGDVNASCTFNGIDITYFVSFLKGGPALHYCETCPPAAR
jgi:hypothetical protein